MRCQCPPLSPHLEENVVIACWLELSGHAPFLFLDGAYMLSTARSSLHRIHRHIEYIYTTAEVDMCWNCCSWQSLIKSRIFWCCSLVSRFQSCLTDSGFYISAGHRLYLWIPGNSVSVNQIPTIIVNVPNIPHTHALRVAATLLLLVHGFFRTKNRPLDVFPRPSCHCSNNNYSAAKQNLTWNHL